MTTFASQPDVSKPTIWVVEDSPEDFAALQRAITRPAPATALRRWTRAEDLLADLDEAERPDLLIVDLNLPGIDGAELIQRVRSSDDPQLRVLPICVLSSSTREADMQRCREAGADDYRIKPARIAGLRELAEHALGMAQRRSA